MKTRFAPSPTGFLHVGNLRTALFAYLFAKKNGGKFLLRIEDTDRERFIEGGVENILNSLHWAGIKLDEGVDLTENGKVTQTGDNGPYIQSERLEIYKKYIDEIVEKGHAYYCFCSKERLEEVKKSQELNKQPTGYDGCCRDLSLEEAKKKIEAGESYVIRMKMPKDGVTELNDLVRGKVEFKNELIDDQVLLKTDGFPTYHLAVVVDDHLMGITHVIRGEDWLPSTPKHLELYKMFGWEIPQFAHLSLLVNEKKQKLSKRHGDVSVEDFKEKGYLPEALVNFIAFLGWNPGDEREIFSLEQLEKEFNITQVGKAPSVFDREKLNWYNQQYIMKMNPSELADRAKSFFVNQGINISAFSFQLSDVVALEQGRANTLIELVDNLSFIFATELQFEPDLLVWKKATKEDAKEKLSLLLEFLTSLPGVAPSESEDRRRGEWNKEILEEKVLPWIKEQGFGNGDVLWPVRVALSGLKNSPGPFEIAGVLGKEKTLDRVKMAVDKLS